MPILKHPYYTTDSGKELWRIWDPNVNYEDFLSTHSKKKLEEAVGEYCRHLTQEVSQYQEALTSDLDGLVAAMELAEETYKLTVHENELNADFIMYVFCIILY